MSARILAYSLIVLAAVSGTVGCAKKELSCPDVGADQKSSFMPLVEGYPLTISVDSNFTSSERQAIQSAVAEWNAVGQATAGTDIFVVSFEVLSSAYRSLNPKDCSQTFGSEKKLSLVREESSSHWKSMGFNSSIPAATLRCDNGSTVTQQVIYVDASRTVPTAGQFTDMVAHEMGHAIGLNHSCDDASGGSTSYLACNGLAKDHPYYQAVMYPWLKTSSSNANSLQTNDKTRGACVIGSQ